LAYPACNRETEHLAEDSLQLVCRLKHTARFHFLYGEQDVARGNGRDRLFANVTEGVLPQPRGELALCTLGAIRSRLFQPMSCDGLKGVGSRSELDLLLLAFVDAWVIPSAINSRASSRRFRALASDTAG
jgi:hypothetical protein